MITSVKISNFKSLADFSMEGIGKFACLVGLNGSGKTTLLQALDFIAHVAGGEAQGWRDWSPSELLTKGGNRRTISLEVGLELEGRRFSWTATYNVDQTRCTHELVVDVADQVTVLHLQGGKLSTVDAAFTLHDVSQQKYQGSILSAFKFKHPLVNQVIDSLRSLKNLELLSPHLLRGSSQAAEDIGRGGESLPGFIGKLTKPDSEALMRDMANFYPALANIAVQRKRFGWKSLLFAEGGLSFESRHINDGLLRMLAVLSQRYSPHSILLFDEIENGINQELVGKLVDALQDFNGKQVMVTTHSSLVLNYLDDEVAREGVFLLYKDAERHTRAVKLFQLRALAKKLGTLGPGEAMSDTDLGNLDYEARVSRCT